MGCETMAMVVPYARPLVEEIAILAPRILRQMLGRTVELPSRRPQNAQFLCAKEMVQEIVSEDDHEETTLQSDAETAKKVTTNETYTLLSAVTTGKTEIPPRPLTHRCTTRV